MLPFEATPGIRYLKRILAGATTITSASWRAEVLCPEEIGDAVPAVFLSGELDKVTASHFMSTVEHEIGKLFAEKRIHAPTIAYHLKNARLLDGAIYAGPYKHLLSRKQDLKIEKRSPVHLPHAALASSYVGTMYFGHWLNDDCLTYLLSETYGMALCVRRSSSSGNTGFDHYSKYEVFLNEDWTPTERADIDNLVIFQDHGQNSLKLKRYLLLRERLAKHFCPQNLGLLTYLKRGKSGESRGVENEDEIAAALTARGFIVLDINTDPLETILGALTNSKIVVSIEGSQLCHATLAIPPGGSILTMQPPDRFTSIHRDWTECVGVGFGFVVGSKASNGYSFSAADILRTADLLLNKA